MRLWRWCLVGILAIFIAAVGLAIVYHTTWGRDRAVIYLQNAIRTSGWRVSYASTEGSLPREISFYDVVLQSPQGDVITIGSLRLQLSLLRILKREVAFNEFQADKVRWERNAEPSVAAAPQSETTGLPFTISFPHLMLTNVALPNSNVIGDFDGRLKIVSHNRRVFLDIYATRRDLPKAEAHLLFLIRRNHSTLATLDLTNTDISALSPWFTLPAEGNFDLHVTAKGKWPAFSQIIFQTPMVAAPIFIDARSTLDLKKIEGGAMVNDLFARKWSIHSSLLRTANGEWKSNETVFNSDLVNGFGKYTLSSQGELQQADVQFSTHFKNEHIEAPLVGHLQMAAGSDVQLHLSSSQLQAYGLTFDAAKVDFTGRPSPEGWTGKTDVRATLQSELIEGTAQIALQPKSLHIESFDLHAPFLSANGNVDLALPAGTFTGEIQFDWPHIHEIARFIPSFPFYGSLSGTVRSQTSGAFEIDAKGAELYYGKLEVPEAVFHADLQDLKGSMQAEMLRVNWHGMLLNRLFISTSSGDENWPFTLETDGHWKGPLELEADGVWNYKESEFKANVQNFAGSLLRHPLSLAEPIELTIAPDKFHLSPLHLMLRDASLKAEFDHSGTETVTRIALEHFPMDILSLNPIDLAVSGTVDLSASLRGSGGHSKGTLSMSFNDIEIGALKQAMNGHGSIALKLDHDRLDLGAHLQAHGKTLMRLSSSIPCQVELWPFHFDFNAYQKASGSLAYDGHMEEFLDFFDLGPHRLEGNCQCDIGFSGDLHRPHLHGFCRIENGRYENYFTGTELKDLTADGTASQSRLTLESLTAHDGENGQFSMNGEIEANIEKKFPFQFSAHLVDFHLLQTDRATAEANGSVHLTGDLDAARATGSIDIAKGDLLIPDHLPRNLPNLQVKYVNVTRPLPEPLERPDYKPYPLSLDLRVQAPANVSVSGRGLTSEWKGDFAVAGTYTDPEVRGKLELMSGEFNFSGRSFAITEGSISFTGKPHEQPHLNLAGRMSQSGVEIIARLNGPLTSPQLSFQSLPPLPMGSIISYLLFGQDMSEISPLQAVQLVNSVATVSGQGPDVLETTRRSLGIDRLRIIATPAGGESGDAVALQVGKYVAKGVIVSVSQGTEDSSTNISIEVELPKGFIFEAQSQQEQEQGKFTLKWNKNY